LSECDLDFETHSFHFNKIEAYIVLRALKSIEIDQEMFQHGVATMLSQTGIDEHSKFVDDATRDSFLAELYVSLSSDYRA